MNEPLRPPHPDDDTTVPGSGPAPDGESRFPDPDRAAGEDDDGNEPDERWNGRAPLCPGCDRPAPAEELSVRGGCQDCLAMGEDLCHEEEEAWPQVPFAEGGTVEDGEGADPLYQKIRAIAPGSAQRQTGDERGPEEAPDPATAAGGDDAPDAGNPDAGSPDAGSPDAGSPDTGSPSDRPPDRGPERRVRPTPGQLAARLLEVVREARVSPPPLPGEDIELATEPIEVELEKETESGVGSPLFLILLIFLYIPGWIVLGVLVLRHLLGRRATRTLYPVLRFERGTRRNVHLLELRDAPLRPTGCDPFDARDLEHVVIGLWFNGFAWEVRLTANLLRTRPSYRETLEGDDDTTALLAAERGLRQLLAFLPLGTRFTWRVAGLRLHSREGEGIRGVPAAS